VVPADGIMFSGRNTEGAQHSSGADRLLELRLMDAFEPRSVKIADAPLSVTDLYTVGIGPSSSHTVGPMKAAAMFARELVARRNNAPARILVELFGSLALTGKGRRTDIAVILGLMGWMPETVDPGSADALVGAVRETKVLPLGAGVSIDFNEARDLIFRKGDFHPGHPNTVSFTAFTGKATVSRTFCSVGGALSSKKARGDRRTQREPNPIRSRQPQTSSRWAGTNASHLHNWS
jgi:hypothetical protein